MEIDKEYIKEEKRIENQSYLRTLYETNKVIAPYPLLILLSLTLYFTLFPAPTFSRRFESLQPIWSTLIFAMSANVGDIVGKYFAEVKGSFNHNSLMYLFFIRLYFFFPVTFLAIGADQDDPLTNN
ncbi:MAG: hypothetical protein KDD45_12685 [Bdellovibrionales bacterium]|nr:hypothetical protein [Bdellovibrionales bacterium]